MELTLDQALQKGVEAHKAGKVQEADRYYTAILKANPKHPDANHNMGVLAVSVGKVEEALPFFKTALGVNPNIAQYWLSYIDALIKIDRMADAELVFEEAKSKGAKGDGFDRLGKHLAEIGKASAGNSASKKPQEPPEEQIQGLLNLYTQGKYKDTQAKALQLLKDFPFSVTLYNTLGAANQGVGRLKEAIEAYSKAISIEPDLAEPYYNIGTVLKGVVFTKPNKYLQKTIYSILDKKTYVRPKDIIRAAVSLLKFEPSLKKHLQVSNDISFENLVDIISDLNKLPLLLKVMIFCPLPDLELEKLLINLRRAILSNILSQEEDTPELLGFQSALALQCFTNEYIYSQTEEETKILQSLEDHLKIVLENNEQPNPRIILALASYKALNQFDWCQSLVVTDYIKEVYKRQVEEPNLEEKLKKQLSKLGEITDSVSLEVRAQYEEQPYPRWINLRLPLKPISISEVVDEIKLKLPNREIIEVENPEILIAGCGTGQNSIGTASRIKGSKVLAIDLSLSSLAYAKRKTEEFGIENIEYMQADILDLGQLKKKFDIIESGGVLHHMDNPKTGWKVLTNCLKTGGLMKIGLYSELARNNIVTIREEIRQLNIGATIAEMKSFRDTVIRSDNDHHKLILNFPDFYSLSELRDLLFHVQEHRFTINQIKGHLDELGLKFCGFEADKIVSHFKQTYKNKGDPYNLDKWQIYEECNPTVFASMYQFWCQKIT